MLDEPQHLLRWRATPFPRRPDTVDLPPGARRIYPDEPRESYVRSDHDRINDEGAERLHREFGGVLPGRAARSPTTSSASCPGR
jgi:hypothetical protein